VLLSNVAEDAGVGCFGFFEFALVGIRLLVGTIAIIVSFGERLLPYRNTQVISPDLSAYEP
jgi:hypothetical protein